MTKYTFAVGLLVVSILVRGSLAQDAESPITDEAAIRAAGEDYVEAFNNRDVAALAGQWSPDAVYVNRMTGDQVVGREAIQRQFETLFESDSNLQLAVRVDSIQFVSPNVATEHGVATFIVAEENPEQIVYTAVYVRHDGKWLLDRVSDKDTLVDQSNYKHLKQLEWMIGDWMDEDEDVSIVTECKWTKNKSYLVRSFAVSVADRINMSGMQIIGWDAAAKQVRSWTFDSEGGFFEGQWTNKGDRWFIQKKGITADGSKTSAVNVVTYVDDDAFKLQSTQRIMAGELLPNIDEVLVVRQ